MGVVTGTPARPEPCASLPDGPGNCTDLLHALPKYHAEMVSGSGAFGRLLGLGEVMRVGPYDRIRAPIRKEKE